MKIESAKQRQPSPEEKQQRVTMWVSAIKRAYQLKTERTQPNALEIDEILAILFIGVPKDILTEVETEVRKQIK